MNLLAMEYKNEAFSEILPLPAYSRMLDAIMRISKQNGIESIQLLFGSAWGNSYKDWQPFLVKVDGIIHEIVAAEGLTTSSFGNNDLFIFCETFDAEILFCHEMDIHLRYNESNPFVQDILTLWWDQGILRSGPKVT